MMSRADLLALSPDDLATLTNRGTVKRAQKELEQGELTCDIADEQDGALIFRWSDGTTCRFPAGRSVHEAICSSGLSGISRHVIRSVLAYQRANAAAGLPVAGSEQGVVSQSNSPAEVLAQISVPDQASNSEAPALRAGALSATQGVVWDPGAISDDELSAHFRKAAIVQARKRFEEGILVELTRGTKPVARFLDEGCTVRFPVPGDLRYASADCAESLLPIWVPVAVWAFRELPPDRLAGLLCLQQSELPVPMSVLDSLDALLAELCREGLGGVADTWPQRLARVEQSLRDEGLVWPAELVVDLLHQCEMYRQHDARFEPRQLVQLLGELAARRHAIVNGTRAVPQPLVRGTRSDRPTEIAGGRMIGVGLGVRTGKRHTTISAFLQDVDSGSLAAVERTFADPDPKSADVPRTFADLAATVLVRGVSLANLASSQLLLKAGKRTPGGQLILPRTAASLSTHPQSYQWEQLKPPFAADNFAQLSERFEMLPPSCLRPRRRTENLHVIAVNGADQVTFDAARQKLIARLRDARGDVAELAHPFHARARAGFNDLFNALERRGSQIRFICGHVRSTGKTLEIQPVSLVLDDGDRRIGIQPWLPKSIAETSSGPGIADDSRIRETDSESPIETVLSRLEEQLADLLLTGLNHSHARNWVELAQFAQQLGFIRLTTPVAGLADALSSRANSLDWSPDSALRHCQELALLSRLAGD